MTFSLKRAYQWWSWEWDQLVWRRRGRGKAYLSWLMRLDRCQWEHLLPQSCGSGESWLEAWECRRRVTIEKWHYDSQQHHLNDQQHWLRLQQGQLPPWRRCCCWCYWSQLLSRCRLPENCSGCYCWRREEKLRLLCWGSCCWANLHWFSFCL